VGLAVVATIAGDLELSFKELLTFSDADMNFMAGIMSLAGTPLNTETFLKTFSAGSSACRSEKPPVASREAPKRINAALVRRFTVSGNYVASGHYRW
jgi:hypothetical protein